MINTIFWDLGGTIVRPTYNSNFEFISNRMEKAGIDYKKIPFQEIVDFIELYRGVYFDKNIHWLTQFEEEIEKIVYKLLKDRESLEFLKLCDYLIHDEDTLILDEEIKEILFQLKEKGFQQILISNWPVTFYFVSERFKLYEIFDSMYVSSFQNSHKPNADMFLRAKSFVHKHPSEIVMIGNSQKSDIVPAEKLGIETILFSIKRESKIQLKERLRDHGIEI